MVNTLLCPMETRVVRSIMKLLFCTKCGDMFAVIPKKIRSCECGAVSGAYEDDGLNAWYAGNTAVPFGFLNSSFMAAVIQQPERGNGKEFTAFVIPKVCPTFKKK